MNSKADEDVARMQALLRRMLDPEDLGHAVSVEVRRLVSAELARLQPPICGNPHMRPPT